MMGAMWYLLPEAAQFAVLHVAYDTLLPKVSGKLEIRPSMGEAVAGVMVLGDVFHPFNPTLQPTRGFKLHLADAAVA